MTTFNNVAAAWSAPSQIGDDSGIYSPLLDLLEQPDWFQRAACRGSTELMFTQARGDQAANRRAKAICRTCPVVAECFELVVSLPHQYPGVYAGMSQKERQHARYARRRSDRNDAA